MTSINFDAPVAFSVVRTAPPAVEIRVNFGIMAGREATAAEIDDLGRALLAIVPDVSIVSENHYEMGQGHEAVVHLVKIELDEDDAAPSDELQEQLVAAAGDWAATCAQARHTEL
jgi:hypothetical protein